MLRECIREFVQHVLLLYSGVPSFHLSTRFHWRFSARMLWKLNSTNHLPILQARYKWWCVLLAANIAHWFGVEDAAVLVCISIKLTIRILSTNIYCFVYKFLCVLFMKTPCSGVFPPCVEHLQGISNIRSAPPG